MWTTRKRTPLKTPQWTASHRGAYLVLQTPFEVAHEVSRLIALKFSALHGLAPQIVVHLDREDGRCRAFILGAFLSWDKTDLSYWRKSEEADGGCEGRQTLSCMYVRTYVYIYLFTYFNLDIIILLPPFHFLSPPPSRSFILKLISSCTLTVDIDRYRHTQLDWSNLLSPSLLPAYAVSGLTQFVLGNQLG